MTRRARVNGVPLIALAACIATQLVNIAHPIAAAQSVGIPRPIATRHVAKGADAVVVSEAYTHPALRGGSGVVYATIRAAGADALRSASSPVSQTAELHESMRESRESGSMPGMAMEDMKPIARLPIARGATVRLAPGGYHLMLVGLRRDLTAGMQVPVTLRFERAGPIVVVATVRPF